MLNFYQTDHPKPCVRGIGKLLFSATFG